MKRVIKFLEDSSENKKHSVKDAKDLLNDYHELERVAEKKRESARKVQAKKKILEKETIRVNKTNNERIKSLLNEAVSLMSN